MPRSAVADGHVDYVLPPPEIARQLARLADHPYTGQPGRAAALPPEAAGEVDQILNLLRASTQVDFSHCKQTTVRRRIFRRMALRGLERLDEYLAYLRETPAERQELYRDLLINVTRFFRDPQVFDVLKERGFPSLLDDRSPAVPLRVWVAGYSTCEEAYSLAINLLEYLDSRGDSVAIKILATDVNEEALQRARAGIYLDNIEMDVSPERLRRFFARVNGQYQISKAVRDLCVFSRHNVLVDPPFATWTWSAAATCSFTWTCTCNGACCRPSTTPSTPAASCCWAPRRAWANSVNSSWLSTGATGCSARTRGRWARPWTSTSSRRPGPARATVPRRPRGPRCGARWTCKKKPTARCWPGSPPPAW
jgi:chemotaxis methyl-accepting protein methylase